MFSDTQIKLILLTRKLSINYQVQDFYPHHQVGGRNTHIEFKIKRYIPGFDLRPSVWKARSNPLNYHQSFIKLDYIRIFF